MPTYDPGNARQMNRLREEYDYSREELKHSRKMYVDTFKRYAGDRYAAYSGVPETYILMTRMAFGIMRRHLVADNIRTMVSSPVPDLMPSAENLRIGLDDKLDEMELASIFKTWVTAAIAKMGILWVGLNHWNYDGGETGVLSTEFIDFRTWTHDMWARSPRDFSFCGHRRRVSYDDAMDNPLFLPDTVSRLRDVATARAVGTDESIDDMDGRWGHRGVGDAQFFEFDSIYLPKQRITIGLPCDGAADLLHEPIPDEGPEEFGPYHLLCYDTIPNKVLPSPPSDAMAKIDDLANSLMRKIAEDGKNAKTVTLFQPGGADDVEKIRRAANLEFIPSMNPDGLRQVTFNGVSAETMGAFLQAQRLFSWANGGLETLGGLAVGADTARQEQQLLQTAGGMIDEMKSTTVAAMSKVIRHIAHYLWRDEMWRPVVPRRAPGIGSIGMPFEVEERMGDLDQYRITIWPYSATPITPQSKFQAMDALMQRAQQLLPLAQMGAIDFERAIKHYARWLDIDELEDVFNILDTTGMPGPENTPQRETDTTRRYVRESKSGVTPEAQDNQLLESMRSDEQ